MPPADRSPSRRRRDERGIAALVAMIAIVVIGALVMGSFVAGRMDMVSGRATTFGRQAFEVAETGLAEVLADWERDYNLMAIGVDTALATGSPVASLRYLPTLTRMNGGHYLLRVRGERLGASNQVLATRTLGRFLRLYMPNLDIQAAVTAQGQVTIRGNTDIVGFDTDPPNWTGCGAHSDKAGVRTDSTTSVAGPISVTGTPPTIPMDSTVVDSIFTSPFNALLPFVDVTLPAGSYNGMAPTTSGTPAVCDFSNTNNWGEPLAPPASGVVTECRKYFPIILINGDATLQTGRGQGILLVNGNLELRGNVEFDGIVITMGTFRANGMGNKVIGGVLARYTPEFAPTSGNPKMFFSSCAISRALQYSAHAVPLTERSWAQLY